jgi:hypothetical protein
MPGGIDLDHHVRKSRFVQHATRNDRSRSSLTSARGATISGVEPRARQADDRAEFLC